ncbi:MAG: hypothetical protein ACRDVM_09860 [Acidimicrobiia bacterium]
MPWFWTDDLARALIEAGEASQSRVAAWIRRPVALAAGDHDPLAVARQVMSEDEKEDPLVA